MTEGIDSETLDGINLGWFNSTSEDLLKETYRPRPVRRVLIPKPNGKTRPLGVGSPRDKIIQQSMKIVMETILEGKFLNTSHGFRPNRGCHTALKEIRNWGGVNWFVEGDIKSFFDTIDHNLLASLIQKHFADKRLMNLYWKIVKAGYIEFNRKKTGNLNETHIGVPQGGIISPLLSNLILNELDVYVEKLKKDTRDKSQGMAYLPNPSYQRLDGQARATKKKIIAFKKVGAEITQLKEKYRELIKMRWKVKSLRCNPEHRKIEYVRYADDWLIGIWGPKNLAISTRSLISKFLAEWKLELSLEKTLITHARYGKAKFLGTRITLERGMMLKKQIVKQRIRRRRLPGGNIIMLAPFRELGKRLIENGFATLKNGKWEAKPIKRLTPLPDRDIVLRYRYVLWGYLNYYSFTDNIRIFYNIYWVLRESLRKTIQLKHKFGYNVFKNKFGENITIRFQRKDGREMTIDFTQPQIHRNPWRFKGARTLDPMEFLNREVRTVNSFGDPCANCGSEMNVEMHHLKHIRTLNLKLSGFDQMMAKINRKQIPLCASCHRKVHQGKYVGMSLKHLPQKQGERTK